jgi:hypothetical protein
MTSRVTRTDLLTLGLGSSVASRLTRTSMIVLSDGDPRTTRTTSTFLMALTPEPAPPPRRWQAQSRIMLVADPL